MSFAIIDAARINHLCDIDLLQEKYEILFLAKDKEALSFVAPHIFSFYGNGSFLNLLKTEGWGNAWGIFVMASVTFEELVEHFRKFLFVQTEDGQELYFRFYDPRVLKIFLPTCDEKQIVEFFGPVEKFIVEGETKEDAIEFSHRNGVLQQKKIKANEVFGNMEAINA